MKDTGAKKSWLVTHHAVPTERRRVGLTTGFLSAFSLLAFLIRCFASTRTTFGLDLLSQMGTMQLKS
jgi:hypothetical protein